MLHGIFNQPVVGGADGPQCRSPFLQQTAKLTHLRKDVGTDHGVEKYMHGLAEFGFAQVAVDLHHLAADGEFGNFTAHIGSIPLIHPVAGFAREQSGFHGILHEPDTGVTRPKCAIAVEYGDSGLGSVNETKKFRGGESGDFRSYEFLCQNKRPYRKNIKKI